MSKDKIRVVVNTNTNVRFLTALPADITFREALPVVLSKYKTVVSENIANNQELLQSPWITELTLKGCLIGREEVLGEVLGDGDQL